MPKYTAIAVVTLDGKIAKDKNHLSTDWTSEEDKSFFRAVLKQFDVVLVGNNTFQTAKEPLSKRNCIVLTKSVNKPIVESTNLSFVNTLFTDLNKFIENKGYESVAILGGAQVYAYCLENNLLDELYLTLEPIVFGQGINLFESKLSLNNKFTLLSEEKLNSTGTILLKYKKT